MEDKFGEVASSDVSESLVPSGLRHSASDNAASLRERVVLINLVGLGAWMGVISIIAVSAFTLLFDCKMSMKNDSLLLCAFVLHSSLFAIL